MAVNDSKNAGFSSCGYTPYSISPPQNVLINIHIPNFVNFKMSNQETVNNKNTYKSYSLTEDMAILNYVIKDNNYLKAAGVQLWKNAEKENICPGRSYLSLKERFRKVIIKNLNKYKVDKEIISNIKEFCRANANGKRVIRYNQSST